VTSRLLENIKSFGYQVPQDPEKLLYDFYFMIGYLHGDREDKIIDFVFKEAVKDCVNALHKHMLMALLWSLSCEARHAEEESDIEAIYEDFLNGEPIGNNDEKYLVFWQNYFDSYENLRATKKLPTIAVKTAKRIQKVSDHLSDEARDDDKAKWINITKSEKTSDLEKKVAKIMMQATTKPSARKNAFYILLATKEKVKFSSLDVANAFIFLFKDIEWYEGYGGDSWADIAIAYKKLLESSSLADKIVWIDHAYDLQHNNGTVFSKVSSYDKNGFGWLQKALSWKKNATDLRGFYDRVSGSLKPVVAWVAKNEHGKALDTYEAPEIHVGDFVEVKPSKVIAFKCEASFWGWETSKILDPQYYKGVAMIIDNPDFDEDGGDPEVVSIKVLDSTGVIIDAIHEIPASFMQRIKKAPPKVVVKAMEATL
jgi:hypothetical protein